MRWPAEPSDQITVVLECYLLLSVPFTEAKLSHSWLTLFFLTRTSPNLLCDIASPRVCSLTRHIYLFIYTFCLFCLCVYVCGHVCHSTHVGIRGQLVGVGFFFCHVGSRDQTQILRLVTDLFSPPAPNLDNGFVYLFVLFLMLNPNLFFLSLPNWISEIANAQTSMRKHQLQTC